MKERRRITRETSVSEVDTILRIEPDLVRENDPLLAVAHKIVEKPTTRVIGVVDAANKLLGVIPLRHVCEHIFYEIVPEEQFLGIATYEDVIEFARHSRGGTAADLMEPPVFTKFDETIKDAIEKMYEADLDGLIIVDDELHVVGYIDMLELLAAWILAKRE